MRTALTALVALLVVSLFPAGAGAKLPVGSADGVRIVRERGAIVVVFTPAAQRLWRRVRGRVASVMCWEREIPDETGLFAVTSGGGGSLRAPKRSRRLRTGDHTRGMDYCRVWLEPRTVTRRGARVRLGRRLVVSIPLTQRGAVYLDEQSKALELRNVLLAASFAGDDTFPTPAEFRDFVERRGGRWRAVALPGPDATPPAGSLGYYSDGAQRAAAVNLSASGRRLFIEYQPDGVLRTNVARYIYGDLD